MRQAAATSAPLPDGARDAWLVRLARSEPHLDVRLLHRLREVGER